ncbi:MAG TPA: PP2C family protein-serine/threonine phosphatase [Pseudonocardiaceae bacterium]|nr:PP2C family protein-serine/threonine phosphatase [Pseudonocardiaceae bacterium]
MGSTALVVAEPTVGTADLDQALAQDGFLVRRADPAELLDAGDVWFAADWSSPEFILASASLGLQRVALLSRRLVVAGRAPTIVVFPEDDMAALEACVLAGFDYVLPPFRPALLRSRVRSCWERGQLTRAVEEMTTEARLLEYERDLSIAHDIQSGFLPDELPIRRGWELAARFHPAKQVAGDFYDAFELVRGRRIGFVVADVCDKGLGAALFMALIRTLLRHTAEHTAAWSLSDAEPDVSRNGFTADLPDGVVDGTLPPLLSVGAGPLLQAVLGTNRYMARNHIRQGYFATLFFGVLDPVSGSVVYINGGHNPPVVVRQDGSHQLLEPTGPAVGMMPNSVFALGHTSLEPGDRLFVYTDGVVEARDSHGAMLGTDKMLDVVRRPCASADTLLDSVETRLHRHVGSADQFDDITMLVLHRLPQ